MLIILFFLITFVNVSPHLIAGKTFSHQMRSHIENDLYLTCYNSYKSNNLYSNAFNSGNFYNSYSSSITKSRNLYITQVDSLSQAYVKSTNVYYQTSSYSSITKSRNLYITQVDSLSQAYVKSTNVYSLTYNPTTIKPSLIPTLVPTQLIEQSLTFETSITLTGFTQPVIDADSLTAIIFSIAKSANISFNYVSIKEYSFINGRRRLFTLTLQNLYNLLLVSQISIPFTNVVNPYSIYVVATNNIQTSINSGAFITYLLSLNSSISGANLTISNYTMSQMNIVINVPTSLPTSIFDENIVPHLNPIIVFKIVFISMAIFISFLFVFMLIIKKFNKYEKLNTISHNNINIHV
jgi:hypothetical protein